MELANYEKVINSVEDYAFEWDKLGPLEKKAIQICDLMEFNPVQFVFNNQKLITLDDMQLGKLRLEWDWDNDIPHPDYYVEKLEDVVDLLDAFYEDYNLDLEKAQDKSVLTFKECVLEEVW